MAYESYKISQTGFSSPKDIMLDIKKHQVRYLFDMAADREDGCTINDKEFEEWPRIFDRKIKTNYFQTITCESILKNDYFGSGSLLNFDNDNWICTSSFIFHGLYCKGSFIRCNYILKWQNISGDIIARPCLVQSAAQYNSGEVSNKTITIGSDQLMIVLPLDDETIMLDSPKSFFIDKNKTKPTPYKVTRNDVVPYSDWDEGCINLIVTQRQIDKNDNIEHMICDYFEPTILPPPGNETGISSVITGDATLKIGRSRTYTVSFYDKGGVEIPDVQFEWKIQSDFSEHINFAIDGSMIKISVSNRNYIGSSFLLQIVKDETVIADTTITITDIY